MREEYDQILDVVAKHPGATVEKITDLVRDLGITDISETLSTAVSNDDLLEFDGRYWVMRTGKYRYNRYGHSET